MDRFAFVFVFLVAALMTVLFWWLEYRKDCARVRRMRSILDADIASYVERGDVTPADAATFCAILAGEQGQPQVVAPAPAPPPQSQEDDPMPRRPRPRLKCECGSALFTNVLGMEHARCEVAESPDSFVACVGCTSVLRWVPTLNTDRPESDGQWVRFTRGQNLASIRDYSAKLA